MKKISVIILSCLIVILMLFVAINAKRPKKPKAVKWNVYTCDVLPDDGSLASMAFGTSNVAGDKTKNEIVDDSEISGNKVLMHSNELENRMQWKHSLSNIKGLTTIVIRAKAVDVNAFENSFEVDIHMQPKGYREIISATKDGKIKLKYTEKESNDAVDTSAWHIYRMTLSDKEINVYVDESDKPIITAPITKKSTKDDYFRFGSNARDTTYGCYYDWIIWTVDTAGAPSEAPLPAGLTGVK